MVFLVDFENVQNSGLKGARYLVKEDRVIIFYSQACEWIRQGIFLELMESFCYLELCKLKKPGKNALDFYIATKLGAIFGEGYMGKAAIVSRDQGFTAIRDFWKEQGDPVREVVLGGTLEQCILSANENHLRTEMVKKEMKTVRLETEFARYQERMKVRAVLEEIFADTGFDEQMKEIQCLYEKQSGKKLFYLDAVKTFGRQDGLEIYRRMRRLIG